MPGVSHDDLRSRAPLPLQTGTYVSQALGRTQPYAYFLPKAGESGGPYPLLVLLHGRDSSHLEWARYTRIARYAAAYRMVIAFPEGGNHWYTDAVDGSVRAEADLLQGFLPHLQATLPLQPAGKAWGIGGLSMGGYGAVKIALKHPALFSLAVSHSGALEKPMMPETHTVFGDPQADAGRRRAENPFALAESAMCRWPTERPFLYLDCGEGDFLLDANRRFKDHLNFIGYPHRYTELPGQHTWPYWDRAFRTILPTVAARLGAEPISARMNTGK